MCVWKSWGKKWIHTHTYTHTRGHTHTHTHTHTQTHTHTDASPRSGLWWDSTSFHQIWNKQQDCGRSYEVCLNIVLYYLIHFILGSVLFMSCSLQEAAGVFLFVWELLCTAFRSSITDMMHAAFRGKGFVELHISRWDQKHPKSSHLFLGLSVF